MTTCIQHTRELKCRTFDFLYLGMLNKSGLYQVLAEGSCCCSILLFILQKQSQKAEEHLEN